MRSFCVSLKNVRDIMDFVDIVSGYEGHIELVQGKYRINGKSVLGIFSLNLQKPVEINMEKEDKEIEDRLRERRMRI